MSKKHTKKGAAHKYKKAPPESAVTHAEVRYEPTQPAVAAPPTPVRTAFNSETASANQLMEQRRACYALKAIRQALAEPGVEPKELKSYVRRLPGMIQTNGFGQALAFYYSKRAKYRAYGTVYQMIEDWLCQDGQVYAHAEGQARLLRAITEHDQARYRQAQAETMALMLWIKKFAEAFIVVDESNSEEAAS